METEEVPPCPHCGLPTTLADDGMWTCPEVVANPDQSTFVLKSTPEGLAVQAFCPFLRADPH